MPNRPNVLLIITDQQRYDTLHGGGEEAIETPHVVKHAPARID